LSFLTDELADENWQPGDRFSFFGYLKHWCFKALYFALVGRSRTPAQALPIPVRSQAPSGPSPRASRR